MIEFFEKLKMRHAALLISVIKLHQFVDVSALLLLLMVRKTFNIKQMKKSRPCITL